MVGRAKTERVSRGATKGESKILRPLVSISNPLQSSLHVIVPPTNHHSKLLTQHTSAADSHPH